MKSFRTVLFTLAVAAAAHAHDPHKGTATTTVSGTVVDIACFVGHDSIGEKHTACAEACARAGNPLAIYDSRTRSLYLPVSMDHKNPNAKLMPFIEKKVTVKGKVMQKAGLKGIAIESVEAAK